MVKKIISLLLAMGVVVSLTACSGNNADTDTDVPVTNVISNKVEVPISTKKALKSENLEFVYSLSEIPDSFWSENNSEMVVDYMDTNHNFKVLDFSLGIDATSSSGEGQCYELCLKNNDFLIPVKLNAFDVSRAYASLCVMDNHLAFHELSFMLLETSDSALNNLKLKTGEWVFQKVDEAYAVKFNYIYKLNEDWAVALYVGGLAKESPNPYSEEQLKELGEYIISVVEIKETPKTEVVSVHIDRTFDLGGGYTLNLANAQIKSFDFVDANGVGVPVFEFLSKDGEEISFIGYDSEADFENWKGRYLSLKKYKGNISILENNENSFSEGYQGIVFNCGDKYYVLSSFWSGGHNQTDDEYVDWLMDSVVTQSQNVK